ncbi:MAG: hypothetical protein AB1439_11740 [candidate division FCPU426 bacterium]
MPSQPLLDIHIRPAPAPAPYRAAVAQVVLCQNIFLKEIAILKYKEGVWVLLPEQFVNRCRNPRAKRVLEEVVRGLEGELREVIVSYVFQDFS